MLIFNFFVIFLYPTIIQSQQSSTSSSASGTTAKTTTTTTASSNKNVTCVCDNQTTKSNNQGLCGITLDGNNEAVGYNGVCVCQYYEPFYYRFRSSAGLYTVSCIAGTTTTTTTTTTPRPTVPGQTTEEPDDDGSGSGSAGITEDPNEDDEELIYKGSCNTTALSNDKRKITKILTYVASIWVILWTFATFIVNIFCK
uniref:Uncharacterized protein n=1 Tax=Panagrolaimus davidi TaxID=227884 RepID=A0A914PFH8_9BILA